MTGGRFRVTNGVADSDEAGSGGGLAPRQAAPRSMNLHGFSALWRRTDTLGAELCMRRNRHAVGISRGTRRNRLTALSFVSDNRAGAGATLVSGGRYSACETARKSVMRDCNVYMPTRSS